jgi:hypothetical protein
VSVTFVSLILPIILLDNGVADGIALLVGFSED